MTAPASKEKGMPKRVQRKRTKGWKMPPNTVYVGRGSEWGNPFLVDGPSRHTLLGAVLMFRKYAEWRLKEEPDWLLPLRGKNLACYCSPTVVSIPPRIPCHGDILLGLANA